MPRIALFAFVVCVLAVAAAVVSFVEGSFLGIVWVLIAGITSNMTWFYVRKAKMEKAQRSESESGSTTTV
ncbi:hypothetical protein OKJ48_12485 [Streptomyces kunmingensis]|uniref:Secreted protein n=1 Tax=Streptomyces kunmingensis TaxID=68225 RepID=A0ABU6CA37_9ACTN|nr:hypothetical protein [Streptomyces kunmingensis]MEB3961056.1 hypothetical protein [Streptomyces kunmingensis]